MSYLPYVFGLTRLLLGIVIFAISFKLVRKNNQGEFFTKYRTLLKILSVILIVSGFYTLIFSNAKTYQISNLTEDWTEENRETMIETCMRDAQNKAKKFPDETKKYCECSVEGLIKNIPKKQYFEDLKKPQGEQAKLHLKYFEHCLVELKKEINPIK